MDSGLASCPSAQVLVRASNCREKTYPIVLRKASHIRALSRHDLGMKEHDGESAAKNKGLQRHIKPNR